MLEGNGRGPRGGRTQTGCVAAEDCDVAGAKSRAILLDLKRALGERDENVKHLPHLDRSARGDVVRVGRNRALEESRIGPADVADVRDVSPRSEVTDVHFSAPSFFSTRDLRSPGADGETLVATGPLVLEGACDDNLDAGATRLLARQLGRRLGGRVRRDGTVRRSLGRRGLLGLPVDLAGRDDEDARSRGVLAHRVEHVHRADRVHVPGLGGVFPRGAGRRGRRQMHETLGLCPGDGLRKSLRVGYVCIRCQPAVAELREQMASDEALRPCNEDRARHAFDPTSAAIVAQVTPLRAVLLLSGTAVAVVQVAASSATSRERVRWRPLISVHGAFDVSGPRADGRLVIASSQGLFLYRRGGGLTPFARGPGGYQPAIGETYIALARDRRLPGVGCRFRRDDVYILDPAANPGVIKIDRQGRAQRLVSFPGAFLSGITFDQAGRFGSRLLVTARIANKLTLYAVDCRGGTRTLVQNGPQVEGGIAVAALGFGRFGGQLVAADEFSGHIYAIDHRGRVRLLAESGLPGGSDVGVESVGFVPRGFNRRGRAYLADPAAPGSPTEGTDSVLTLSGSDLVRADIRAGDMLVATEARARTIAVRCLRRCIVRRIGRGPEATHGEGHLTVVGPP